MERISVYGLVGSLAVSDSDGEILNAEIEKFLSDGSRIVVDFSCVEVVLTHFLDAAIGALYKKHHSSELKEKLVITGLKSTDALSRTIAGAKSFYLNGKGTGCLQK